MGTAFKSCWAEAGGGVRGSERIPVGCGDMSSRFDAKRQQQQVEDVGTHETERMSSSLGPFWDRAEMTSSCSTLVLSPEERLWEENVIRVEGGNKGGGGGKCPHPVQMT